jgi:hypothetical protein
MTLIFVRFVENTVKTGAKHLAIRTLDPTASQP